MESLPLTVIIPAYNEAATIGELVGGILHQYPDAEVIVVNDGSKDDTADVAGRAGARVFSHPYNIGNGAAVKTGIRNATGQICVFLDGDGQHTPGHIADLLEDMPAYDMVIGARQWKSQSSAFRAIGNTAYNWLASYVAKVRIDDLTSGFRAIKTDIAKRFVYLLPNTYSYPTTLTLGLLRTGRSVKFVPVSTQKRQAGKSQIRLFRDGVRFLMIIARICTLYSPMRVFLPVSALMFTLGLVRYAYSFVTQGRFTNMSALLFVTSVVIFMLSLISEQICQMRAESSENDPLDECREIVHPSDEKKHQT